MFGTSNYLANSQRKGSIRKYLHVGCGYVKLNA